MAVIGLAAPMLRVWIEPVPVNDSVSLPVIAVCLKRTASRSFAAVPVPPVAVSEPLAGMKPLVNFPWTVVPERQSEPRPGALNFATTKP